MRRRELVAALVGVAFATVIAGGIAWGAVGDGGVIQGCYDSGGNLKVVAALPCPKGYTQLAWNREGPQGPQGIPGTNGTNGVNGQDGADGDDGVSVTSETEPAGANCAAGGSEFTAANGVTYACNGAQGERGAQGEAGPPGPGADVLLAYVNADGSLKPGGDALSSVRWSTGGYELTFGRDTTNCAAIVSAELGPGSSTSAPDSRGRDGKARRSLGFARVRSLGPETLQAAGLSERARTGAAGRVSVTRRPCTAESFARRRALVDRQGARARRT